MIVLTNVLAKLLEYLLEYLLECVFSIIKKNVFFENYDKIAMYERRDVNGTIIVS